MKLVVGKKYRDSWDSIQEIAGPTAANPDWVYSIQGNWYVKATGQYVSCIPKKHTDEFVPLPMEHPLTLITEVTDDKLQD